MAAFNRAYRLLIGEDGTQGLLIEDLHVEFHISKDDKADSETKMWVKIYNLANESISRITRDSRIILEAGYTGEEGLLTIFVGDVDNVITSKTGDMTITTVTGIDGYAPKREGYTARAFKSGDNVRKIITEIVTGDLNLPTPNFRNGKLGDSAGINKTYQSGSSKLGNSAEVLTKLCKENNLTWIIRDGVVFVYPVNGSTTIQVPLISAASGMLGSPQRKTQNSNKTKKSDEPKSGFQVSTLLNGTLNVGNLVKIDSEYTQGLYRISKVRHRGAFQGDKWETKIDVVEGITS